MRIRAVCDASFTLAPLLDEERIFDFLEHLTDVQSIGCQLLVNGGWEEGCATEGSLLNYETQLRIKENRDQAWRQLGNMHSTGGDTACEGRSSPNDVLILSPHDQKPATLDCDGVIVNIAHAFDQVSFQSYWRIQLANYPISSAEFDAGLSVAFWNLEFGPKGRNEWGNMGYEVVHIRELLVKHLSYLCDSAVQDFIDAGYNDGEFEKRARIPLSRETKANVDRDFPDARGTKFDCRHHTKLYEGKPGRIYFAVEKRTSVLVGKVCEHL